MMGELLEADRLHVRIQMIGYLKTTPIEVSLLLHCGPVPHRSPHVTMIVPCIFGCSEQKYVYVPGLPSVALYR